MTIEELRAMKKNVDLDLRSSIDSFRADCDAAIEEASRIAEIAENADKIIAKLDDDFSRITGLNKTDYEFLLVAIVLQVLRQVIINKVAAYIDGIDTNRTLQDHNAHDIKADERSAKDAFKNENADAGKPIEGKYKNWFHVLYDSVPYDVTKHTKTALGIGLDGNTHRRRTFGHDPWLGWIFGTANILTDTISLSDFRAFKVYRQDPVTGANGMGILPGGIGFWNPFVGAYQSTLEDKKRLAAAVAAQGIHIVSDRYTKKMLPIPCSTILPESLCGALYDHQWTEFNLACKIKSALPVAKFVSESAFAILINMIIGLVHGLLYNPQDCPSRELYEVKTRKILMYSNLVATSSNAIQAGVRAYFGDPTAMKSLDLGGLVVTLYRVMIDSSFIRQARDLYVFGNVEEMIRKEMSHA